MERKVQAKAQKGSKKKLTPKLKAEAEAELEKHPDLVALGKRIKELRFHSGYSQEALAVQAQMDRSFLAGVESGRRCPTFHTLKKISLGLHTTLSELLEGLD